jgi:hypothetical protein
MFFWFALVGGLSPWECAEGRSFSGSLKPFEASRDLFLNEYGLKDGLQLTNAINEIAEFLG